MNSQEKLQQQVIDSLQIIIEIEQSLIDDINQLLLTNLPIIFNQVETIEYLSKQISDKQIATELKNFNKQRIGTSYLDELIQLPAEIKKSELVTLKLIEIVS
ncbi:MULTISPECIES: hypothetical protein [Leuconostoc]|uniref:hypothetical protein n=1 Tax=Leuconostoc TaxID=1243 RepID=UPI00065FAF05|nr:MULTISPECIES: hypothetical protein [Leuconostoc]MBZ5945570.1 hypothetical protein [Leuconostoc gasicomitatum]MCS8586654.1 hypothetical protein [Leuconostoc citreum]MCS8599059.1 hypothetical protein [Leuconostoc citreum]GEK60372.1 hypothetical protein LCI01_00080 [Leuconostoc citreum]